MTRKGTTYRYRSSIHPTSIRTVHSMRTWHGTIDAGCWFARRHPPNTSAHAHYLPTSPYLCTRRTPTRRRPRQCLKIVAILGREVGHGQCHRQRRGDVRTSRAVETLWRPRRCPKIVAILGPEVTHEHWRRQRRGDVRTYRAAETRNRRRRRRKLFAIFERKFLHCHCRRWMNYVVSISRAVEILTRVHLRIF